MGDTSEISSAASSTSNLLLNVPNSSSLGQGFASSSQPVTIEALQEEIINLRDKLNRRERVLGAREEQLKQNEKERQFQEQQKQYALNNEIADR